jgi:arsenite methyltransferase
MEKDFTFDGVAARRVEQVYLMPDIIEQRRATRALLRAQPGEKILDVGCGPGFLLAEMAGEVGAAGKLCGIDASADMIALARARCKDVATIELQQANALELPFAVAAFDAVVSTQVYEYVADIATALREAARVLRPGGRLLIVATDWESSVWNNSNEARMARVLEAWREHGADSRLPRSLPKRLRDAGLALDTIDVIPIINIEYDSNSYSHSMIAVMAKFGVGRQNFSAAELQAWADDLKAFGERGEYFFSLNRYVFIARKQ